MSRCHRFVTQYIWWHVLPLCNNGFCQKFLLSWKPVHCVVFFFLNMFQPQRETNRTGPSSSSVPVPTDAGWNVRNALTRATLTASLWMCCTSQLWLLDHKKWASLAVRAVHLLCRHWFSYLWPYYAHSMSGCLHCFCTEQLLHTSDVGFYWNMVPWLKIKLKPEIISGLDWLQRMC